MKQTRSVEVQESKVARLATKAANENVLKLPHSRREWAKLSLAGGAAFLASGCPVEWKGTTNVLTIKVEDIGGTLCFRQNPEKVKTCKAIQFVVFVLDPTSAPDNVFIDLLARNFSFSAANLFEAPPPFPFELTKGSPRLLLLNTNLGGIEKRCTFKNEDSRFSRTLMLSVRPNTSATPPIGECDGGPRDHTSIHFEC